MILVLDTGNTNTVIGGIDQGVLRFSIRFQSDRNKTRDEYALLLHGLLSQKGVDPAEIEGGIISSVVPKLRHVLGQALKQLTGKTFLVVGPGLKTGLPIRMDIPSQVGSDLIVDAVAALTLAKPPLVIFDLGTATTMSVVDEHGSYIGGMIIPGLQLSLDALSARAAQLPFINLDEPPRRLIGKNTNDCMHAGAIYSTAAMLDGLIDRVTEELGQNVTTVATGGLMGLIHPYCKREIHYDDNLLLRGLIKLYEMNK